MSAFPFEPVQHATTHLTSALLDGPAPGLAETRGGILSAQDAAAMVRTPGNVSDRTLARACKVVLADPDDPLRPQARLLLGSIPIHAGGAKPAPSQL